ncbi:class I SAM-dependent methyltransferase [bacterium]|nr:class I SAM-dependent methyltransferase [bacterium]
MTENKVLEENIKVHDAESVEYSFLHPEQYNFYQLKVLNKQVSLISEIINGAKREFLDLGCGEGFLTLPFLKAGFNCTSVDASQGMLDVLLGKIPESHKDKVELVNEDLMKFLGSGKKKFDVIGISGVLHHLPDYNEIFDLISKKIKRAGLLFITHEPLKQDVKPSYRLKLHNIIKNADESIYNSRRKPERYMEKHDYKKADYQRQFGGIPPDPLINELESKGFTILIISKFCVRRYGLFAMIANEFIGSQNTFSILALKI